MKQHSVLEQHQLTAPWHVEPNVSFIPCWVPVST